MSNDIDAYPLKFQVQHINNLRLPAKHYKLLQGDAFLKQLVLVWQL